MKKEWLVKTLALGVVVLFISVSFQPIIAEKTISVDKESDYNNVDFDKAKDYLFQTLIDISNNPEVKDLLKQSNQRIFNSDYDYKNVFFHLLLKKPSLLKSMLFAKPTLTYEYIETTYNNGIELKNIIGEKESSKILESVKIINLESFNELKKVLVNNKDLFNRITKFRETNQELKYPIYCYILTILFLHFCIREVFFNSLYNFFHKKFASFTPFSVISLFYLYTCFITFMLMILLDCVDYPTPPHLLSYKN